MEASLFVALEIAFVSKEARDRFGINFHFESLLGGGGGDFRTNLSKHSETVRVRIAATEIGVANSKLSRVFGDGPSMARCGPSDIENCTRVVAAIVKYAQDDFDNSLLDERSYVPVRARTESYQAFVGEGPDALNPADSANQGEVRVLFSRYLEVRKRLDQLLTLRARMAPASARRIEFELEPHAARMLQALQKAYKACFVDIYRVDQCVSAIETTKAENVNFGTLDAIAFVWAPLPRQFFQLGDGSAAFFFSNGASYCHFSNTQHFTTFERFHGQGIAWRESGRLSPEDGFGTVMQNTGTCECPPPTGVYNVRSEHASDAEVRAMHALNYFVNAEARTFCGLGPGSTNEHVARHGAQQDLDLSGINFLANFTFAGGCPALK